MQTTQRNTKNTSIAHSSTFSNTVIKNAFKMLLYPYSTMILPLRVVPLLHRVGTEPINLIQEHDQNWNLSSRDRSCLSDRLCFISNWTLDLGTDFLTVVSVDLSNATVPVLSEPDQDRTSILTIISIKRLHPSKTTLRPHLDNSLTSTVQHGSTTRFVHMHEINT